MPGENLDLSSDLPPADDESRRPEPRFLGVHFQCCNRYQRVYLNRQATAYVGYCPACSRRVEFRIGEGGTDCRFFTAY